MHRFRAAVLADKMSHPIELVKRRGDRFVERSPLSVYLKIEIDVLRVTSFLSIQNVFENYHEPTITSHSSTFY